MAETISYDGSPEQLGEDIEGAQAEVDVATVDVDDTAPSDPTRGENVYNLVDGRWMSAKVTSREGLVYENSEFMRNSADQSIAHDENVRKQVVGLQPGDDLTRSKTGQSFEGTFVNFRSIYEMREGQLTVRNDEVSLTDEEVDEFTDDAFEDQLVISVSPPPPKSLIQDARPSSLIAPQGPVSPLISEPRVTNSTHEQPKDKSTERPAKSYWLNRLSTAPTQPSQNEPVSRPTRENEKPKTPAEQPAARILPERSGGTADLPDKPKRDPVPAARPHLELQKAASEPSPVRSHETQITHQDQAVDEPPSAPRSPDNAPAPTDGPNKELPIVIIAKETGKPVVETDVQLQTTRAPDSAITGEAEYVVTPTEQASLESGVISSDETAIVEHGETALDLAAEQRIGPQSETRPYTITEQLVIADEPIEIADALLIDPELTLDTHGDSHRDTIDSQYQGKEAAITSDVLPPGAVETQGTADTTTASQINPRPTESNVANVAIYEDLQIDRSADLPAPYEQTSESAEALSEIPADTFAEISAAEPQSILETPVVVVTAQVASPPAAHPLETIDQHSEPQVQERPVTESQQAPSADQHQTARPNYTVSKTTQSVEITAVTDHDTARRRTVPPRPLQYARPGDRQDIALSAEHELQSNPPLSEPTSSTARTQLFDTRAALAPHMANPDQPVSGDESGSEVESRSDQEALSTAAEPVTPPQDRQTSTKQSGRDHRSTSRSDQSNVELLTWKADFGSRVQIIDSKAKEPEMAVPNAAERVPANHDAPAFGTTDDSSDITLIIETSQTGRRQRSARTRRTTAA